MIDPSLSAHRQRLAAATDYWYNAFQKYADARRETIRNIAGFVDCEYGSVDEKNKRRMMVNWLQIASQAHNVTLAFNDPLYVVGAAVPGVEGIALRGEEFLNKYSQMIGLGNVARAVVADSFAGDGIFKVASGLLSPSVRRQVGKQEGPMCWRVSPDNFVYDGSATCWDDVSYQANIGLAPLDEAQEYFDAFNPKAADLLKEYTNTQDRVNSTINNDSGSQRYAQPMTRIVCFYFPHANVEAYWPCNADAFGEIANEPLLVRPWTGHPTGPFGTLKLLDIPDNLIPVAAIESNKRLHYLFNELMDITSNQALEAKINPIYQLGAQRDIERWENTPDRKAMPVSDIDKLGILEMPGPTQSQTSFAAAVSAMFKETVGNLDDMTGMGPTAPTAKQSELIRQAVTARTADSRRKTDRCMELVARKLLHLALNDQQLTLPMQKSIQPGSSIMRDVSWRTPAQMPRNPDADDYNFFLVQGSMEMRTPEQRLSSLKEATAEIIQAAMAAAQGIPINMEKFVETQAKYRNLPELREWWMGFLPQYQQQQAQAQQMRMRPPGTGEYTRTSTSEQTNQGAMQESLSQFSDDAGGGRSAVRLAG